VNLKEKESAKYSYRVTIFWLPKTRTRQTDGPTQMILEVYSKIPY